MKYIRYMLLSLGILLGLAFLLRKEFSVNPPIEKSIVAAEGELPLEKLKLPEGFSISVYADNIENARSMAMSDAGILYVGTRSLGSVYALEDTDKDGKIDKKHILLEEGLMPNGVALKDGDLYVAEVNRILKFADIDKTYKSSPEPEVVYDKYPSETHHGWKFISFGPDGKLYVPVGAPCNICKSKDEIFASLTRLNTDGSDMEIVQHGIRNTVGFDWHPETGELWFTDNGRDWMGDNSPECELNHAVEVGGHFGYPYCHQGDVLDPEFGEGKSCDDYIKPAAKLGPHTAPLGIKFIAGGNFPESYKNKMLIARHGSWNREKKIGYDVVLADDDGNVSPFITGWLQPGDQVWGRPVAFEHMADGSMLISDDFGDAIYRVSYREN